ncbi:hypothetical protein BGZ68_010198 [Mortierella alpina]|nr:hypothetical protein BGZ68_010198 [Mortierella alpina]
MPSDPSVHASTCFVSLGCKATLSTLPPELLSRIGSNLSLHEYSFLSRTCTRLHQLLFHPAEVVYFLKVRYRFSIESGSIIIFAYLANMQDRAPLVLERIFDDFFADSELHLQEEQQCRRQRQEQRQRLNEGTYQLSQAIAMSAGAKSSSSSSQSIAIQRLESLEQHKDAEVARRRAKWEAIRMLGVLYALDKTHVGPSSSSNALVLCGAMDVVEATPPSANVTPASLSVPASDSAPMQCAPSASLEPLASSVYPPRHPYTRGQSQVSSLYGQDAEPGACFTFISASERFASTPNR